MAHEIFEWLLVTAISECFMVKKIFENFMIGEVSDCLAVRKSHEFYMVGRFLNATVRDIFEGTEVR